MDAIEDEVRRMAFVWLEYFKQRGFEPHVLRLDFLISIPPGKSPDDFEVHICELTECGGATCGLHVCTRTAAVLNECMADGQECPAGFPKPLPPFRMEREKGVMRPEQTVAKAGRERNGHSTSLQGRASQSNTVSERQPRRRLEFFAALIAVALLLWQRRFSTAQLKRLFALPPIGLFAMGLGAAYAARQIRNALT